MEYLLIEVEKCWGNFEKVAFQIIDVVVLLLLACHFDKTYSHRQEEEGPKKRFYSNDPVKDQAGLIFEAYLNYC